MSATKATTEYFQALAEFQSEITGAFTDIQKKIDPNHIANDFAELQVKLMSATIENLTNTVKTYRKTLS